MAVAAAPRPTGRRGPVVPAGLDAASTEFTGIWRGTVPKPRDYSQRKKMIAAALRGNRPATGVSTQRSPS